ncbi:MAG: pirin family protein [Cyanobacteriota bacterium]
MPSPPALLPGLVFRPAAERFHTRLEWLDSWHSFSFASHVDPKWIGFGPLRVINDDTLSAGRGFGMHPHRDMEIITVMVEGELSHHDSMGHQAVLHAGEVQRMSAGTGIVHSEMNGGLAPCRLLQIWIEPDQAGLPPAYEQQAFPPRVGWTPLLSPDGAGDTLAIQRRVHLWRGRAGAEESLPLRVPPCERVWIQMIAGGLRLSVADGGEGMVLAQGDGLGFDWSASEGTLQSLRSGPQGSDVLLFALS